MGSEQSTHNERKRDAEKRKDSKDLERILEAQRQLYEKRCKELLAQQATRHSAERTTTPDHVNVAPANKQSIAQTSAAAVSPRPPSQSFSNSVNQLNQPRICSDNIQTLERTRTLYIYGQNELQTNIGARSNNLYPNLNNNAPTATAGPSRPADSFRFNANPTQNAKPSVFVNNSGRTMPSAPRERSVSRSRERNNENCDIRCRSCNNTYTMIIYNCPSGHSSCESCKQRGAACGVCRQTITNTRNYSLESYVAERKQHCVNKADGCSLILKLADMKFHVKECPFREMECPLNNIMTRCMWKGKINQLLGHFNNNHSSHVQDEEGKEMHLATICTAQKYAFLVVKGHFNFLFHLATSGKNGMIYMTTQLIGTKTSAQKWTYSIQIYNKRAPRRKYEFVDVCNPSNDSVTDIFKEGRCAALPLPYAMNFVNEGSICYKFNIEKTFKGKTFHSNNQRGRGGHRR